MSILREQYDEMVNENARLAVSLVELNKKLSSARHYAEQGERAAEEGDVKTMRLIPGYILNVLGREE